MRFSTKIVSLATALSATRSSGFAPQPGFNLAFSKSALISSSRSSRKSSSCKPSTCKTCPCPCSACSCACCVSPCCSKPGTALRMSEEPAAEAVEEAAPVAVPEEVAAMDGVLSDEEAHNTDRPARGSGTAKHKRAPKGKPLTELEVGSSVEGKVKTITTYGAFLDIGYASDALLHVSRLSDDFVSNVEDIVKAGDTVTVRVVSVDLEKNQVAVSMRSEEAESAAAQGGGGGGRRRDRPQRSGGDRAAQRATIGALDEKGFDDSKMVEGTVVNTLDFGAFVRFDTSQLGEGFEGELDGLVHISALSAGRANSVEEIVKTGDAVKIRVRSVDSDGGKVSLSMITKEEEEKAFAERGARKPKGRGRAMFSEDEMGAKDWKESMEKLTETMPKFKNMPIVVDSRK